MKKILLITTILLMESCSPYQKYFKYDFDQQKSGTIRTLVITPIDMIRARPQGTDAQSIKKLEIKIQNYLLSNGYNIEPNTALVKNWELESGKLNGFFDPSTGKIDASKISMCLVNAIGKTKTEQNFDAVLFIQLIERPANLMGDRIYWDGCSRKIFDNKGDVITDVAWRGEMNALSLQTQVFDNQHNLIFQNIGAIEFPFELMESYTEKQFEWKKSLQFKDEEIEEGIRIALHPLVPYEMYPKEPNFYDE